MSAADVTGYVRKKLDFFTPDEELDCSEVGDGNVNYIFRVKSRQLGTDGKEKSLIVKQAGETTRLDKTWHLSIDRGELEANYLSLCKKLSFGNVPEIYMYDPVMKAIIMEDLADCITLRTAMLEHKCFPHLAEQISSHLAASLLLTSDVVMDHRDKKLLNRRFINTDLCDIYDRLIYTEPFNDEKGRNIVTPENADFVRENLYENEPLHLAVAKRKFEYMTKAEALIHGDLRTAAVLCNERKVYVFDAEFVCYGPAGCDIGFLIAYLFVGWCNADALMEDGKEKDAYIEWLETSIVQIVDLFIEKSRKLFKEKVTETMAKVSGFEEWRLATILDSAAANTGLEMIQPVVGMDRAPDILAIKNIEKRVLAERILITAGIRFILGSEQGLFRSGADFLNNFLDVARKFEQERVYAA
jgi:5-methylthioribose kinase